MAMRTFFLEDIRTEAFRDTLSPEEQAALDRYLEEMDQDPADGEMDIEWVESGKSYYAHVRYLDGLADERERERYLRGLRGLREDIDAWLSAKTNHYVVGRVPDMMFGGS